MSKEKVPVTAAVRELRAAKVEFTDHLLQPKLVKAGIVER